MIIDVPKTDGVYCIIFRNYLCHCVLQDNRDLPTCQVGQEKECGHHYPCPINPLHSRSSSSPEWHTSTRGFWSKKNSLIFILVLISRQYFQRTTLNVRPRVTTGWCVNIENTTSVKLSPFSHGKSSQRIDTWQPTDREGTLPSWTKLTLDQLIIRLNTSKSRNYATPKWTNVFTWHPA